MRMAKQSYLITLIFVSVVLVSCNNEFEKVEQQTTEKVVKPSDQVNARVTNSAY